MKQIKAAIYARVSTAEQHADKQAELCEEWVKNQGGIVYRTYKDVISGSKESRPEFDILLQDMRQYKFNTIVVTKLDRMGRSLQHLISLITEFRKKGVDFVTVTQPIDTTSAMGRLQFQIMGAFAEFEREIISERTKEGLKKAKNVGKRGKDKKPRKKRGGLRNAVSL